MDWPIDNENKIHNDDKENIQEDYHLNSSRKSLWIKFPVPSDFMKKGNHQSNSSDENENVDLPGKDPLMDVETPQKEKNQKL